ncbi:glucosamine-6-phosphate deaminase [Pedobacter sp. L105]|uniref:glucosamine-6-phosphate deaminase n=1 Tax=Pedobacter sp. L105 TaxID=1641871 RepID=UPI0015766063|nr:glucosamine-6-phosphate deaminase [Pedobacter sp. L105]
MSIRQIQKDQLVVNIYPSRAEMGSAAAVAVTEKITDLLTRQDFVNIIFAAAPSQNEFLTALLNSGVNWGRINAFHMDEYIGLDASASQGFGNFLKERLFDQVAFHKVYYLNGNAADLDEECRRYALLLKQSPADIVCLGIGENTHLAFNDPHVAEFNDPQLVKVVELDLACRQQQVNDGCFETLDQVPVHALTLTIPALYQTRFAYCVVPGEKKAQAIHHTLTETIQENYPSTILRKHPDVILFLDAASASLI